MNQFDNDSGILMTIPIHFYIKKYLSKTHEVDPFELSLNGCHVSAIILEPIDKGYMSQNDRIKLKETYDDVLTFRMNTTLIKQRTRFFIDANSIRRINKMLENKFNHEFFSFVDNLVDHYHKAGINSVYKEDCIRQFIEFYDLQEDYIQFETLKKRYYRYRVPPKIIEPTPRDIMQQQLRLNFIDLESAS